MARKRYTTEQIIGLLREAEVRLGQGQAIGTICRGIGISEQSNYRWRRDYGGLKLDQAKRFVAPGGHLLYVTCSVLPEVNEQQVRRFCEENPEFSISSAVAAPFSECCTLLASESRA